MANCNGTTPSPVNNNCFSSSTGTVSKINCGCTPCDAPVIINQGDVSTQVLVPVLADVIQNCMCINKYETGYPVNWVFQTNILTSTSPSGPVCITGVNYSYDCVGVNSNSIDAYIDSKSTTLTSSVAACSCNSEYLYNQFTGSIKTNSCCCNQVEQAYALTKIVEKEVTFSVCNLKVSITGTIGSTAFTANLIGTVNNNAITSFESPIELEDIGFPSSINFAGRLCLPTNTKITIKEEFDNCIIVDCIRPINTNYTPSVTGSLTYATFTTTADLSLVINKQIYATTTEKLAVMTNSGAQVVCTDGATTTPVCPPLSPCASTTPCPQPVNRTV
ncbi:MULTISPECIES: hypothetical protein [Clostridium]|uniref:hypothetical protein n=1 Tax=Clostridium TaxID=1485 RepID=UPI00051CA250|nr:MULTISPECIES: hypothetical protein [Clostridium]POO85007.1 hypothetical protein C1H59_18345 [Clostridium sp. 3-3]QUF84939.1 hypothetical protein KDJ93_08605 [Clostridium butyricum]